MKNNRNEIISYIKGLRKLYPEELPKGMDLVQEGVEIGNTFEAGYNRFNLESGFESHIAYKKDCMQKGKIVWQILLGLGTLSLIHISRLVAYIERRLAQSDRG